MPANSEQTKIDESHDRRVFTMASMTERQLWERVFPDPMPAGHRISYRWQDMNLIVQPEKDENAVSSTPHGVEGGNVATPSDLAGLSDADLSTAAAELGLSFPKKASRAHKVAAIAAKRVEMNGVPQI